jgi:hypothetical protein
VGLTNIACCRWVYLRVVSGYHPQVRLSPLVASPTWARGRTVPDPTAPYQSFPLCGGPGSVGPLPHRQAVAAAHQCCVEGEHEASRLDGARGVSCRGTPRRCPRYVRRKRASTRHRPYRMRRTRCWGTSRGCPWARATHRPCRGMAGPVRASASAGWCTTEHGPSERLDRKSVPCYNIE